MNESEGLITLTCIGHTYPGGSGAYTCGSPPATVTLTATRLRQRVHAHEEYERRANEKGRPAWTTAPRSGSFVRAPGGRTYPAPDTRRVGAPVSAFVLDGERRAWRCRRDTNAQRVIDGNVARLIEITGEPPRSRARYEVMQREYFALMRPAFVAARPGAIARSAAARRGQPAPRSPRQQWLMSVGRAAAWAGVLPDGRVLGSIEAIETRGRKGVIAVGLCVICRELVFQSSGYVMDVTNGHPETWVPRHQDCIGREAIAIGGGKRVINDLRKAWVQAVQIILGGLPASTVAAAWGEDRRTVWRISDQPDRRGSVNRVLLALPETRRQSQEPRAVGYLRLALARAGLDATPAALTAAVRSGPPAPTEAASA